MRVRAASFVRRASSGGPRLWPAAAAVIAASVALEAQTFKTDTALVTVPVNVTARTDGRLVTGSTADDFRLLEDGVEQVISIVTSDRQPASVCLVVDRSLSIGETRRESAESLVDLMLQQLPGEDEVSLVTFGLEPSVELDWVRAGARVRIRWTNMPKGGGMSTIADALALTIRQMDRATKPRRVIVVMSDGRDIGSVTSIARLAKSRVQSETALYAFGLNHISPRYPGNMRYLQGLVGDSGGYVHVIREQRDTPAAVHDLLAELAGRYLIGYAPKRPFDGKYRRVSVEAKNPALKVRHRGGYLALPSPEP